MCDDGSTYFVKGSNSGVRGLIHEFVASQLAFHFGLPTPNAKIAFLVRDLVRVTVTDWQQDLDFENVFASKSVALCETVTLEDARKVKHELQRDILVFDYWIQNSDRNLGPMGGNVNLLVGSNNRNLHVIDFNLAFEKGVDLEQMNCHVFIKCLDYLPVDLIAQAEYGTRFDRAIAELPRILDKIPDGWVDASPSSKAIIETILERHKENDFWGALT